MIQKSKLTRVAAWLYKTDPTNAARFDIYEVLSCYNLHPKTKINAILTPDLLETIESINAEINDAENRQKDKLRKEQIKKLNRRK
jgi:hypothetical protein